MWGYWDVSRFSLGSWACWSTSFGAGLVGGLAGVLAGVGGGGGGGLGNWDVGLVSVCSARSCCISVTGLGCCSAQTCSCNCSAWASGIGRELHICSAWSFFALWAGSARALAALHCVPRWLEVNKCTLWFMVGNPMYLPTGPGIVGHCLACCALLHCCCCSAWSGASPLVLVARLL